jgi:hypothetical protein
MFASNDKRTKEDIVLKIFEVIKDDVVDFLNGLSPPDAVRLEKAERLKLMVRKFFTAHLNRLEGMCFANASKEEIRTNQKILISIHDRLLPMLMEVDQQWWKTDGSARYYAAILHSYSIVGDRIDNEMIRSAKTAYETTNIPSTRARFLVETACMIGESPEDIRNRLRQAMTTFAELDFKMTPRDRFYHALALQRYHKNYGGCGWFRLQDDDLLLEANFQIGMIFGEGNRWPRHPLWREDVYRRNAHRLGNPEVPQICLGRI